MEFHEGDLFGGFAGLTLPAETIELGDGLTLSRTYAHLMAPFLMAFKPAPPGAHHPGPWHAAKGGLGFDIQAQLFVPRAFAPAQWFDRLNTVWWIAALLRLKAVPSAILPVISNEPFEKGKDADATATFVPVEVEPRQLRLSDETTNEAACEDIDWIKRYWFPAGRLMQINPEFNLLVQAADRCRFVPSPALSLLSLWAALEAVFSPARTELRFRVSANIAVYLEDSGEDRLRLQKQVAKLYDVRSGAAHGSKPVSLAAVHEAYRVVHRVIVKIIETGEAPSLVVLEQRLFGVK